jgi:5-methylcytosine-specific restriction endonuclease McrA
MFELICEFCNHTFEVKERRQFEGKRKRKYCSQSCTGKAIFEKRKDIVLQTSFKKDHIFYPKSSKPKVINPPKKLYGVLNPAFKHGNKSGRLIKFYKKLAFDNFDPECLICKDLKNLHVHHIDGNHFNHHLNNLCILCNSCHQRFHRCKIKLPNPHIISDSIQNIISNLEIKNDFLKIQRRRYLLRKELSPLC